MYEQDTIAAIATPPGEGGVAIVRISGIGFTILRPSLMFGPGDGFFTTLCGLVRYSVPVVPIAGDGGALFQPISVDDVVRCMRRPQVIDQTHFLAGTLASDRRITYVATGKRAA